MSENEKNSDSFVWLFALLPMILFFCAWIFALVLFYGVVVIIFRYAFGVELWNPFE
jgi:hypothetical protein